MESFHICFFGLTCNEKQIICFPYIIRTNKYQKDNLVTKEQKNKNAKKENINFVISKFRVFVMKKFFIKYKEVTN